MRWCRAQGCVLSVVGALMVASGHFPGRARSDDRSDKDRPSPVSVAPEKAGLHRLLDESAGKYAVHPDVDTKAPLTIRCVLRWANQIRGSVDGATYIWTSRGRPVAAVCCYPWYDDICDNFQSLARAPLRAERDGGVAWRP